MARPLKPLPPTPQEVAQEQFTNYLEEHPKPEFKPKKNRGEINSLKNDKVKTFSVGLEDIDGAILYYFNNVIRPEVMQNGQKINVPIIYGNQERWKSVQADGYTRDKNGKILSPLIMFKRDTLTKDRSVGNKLDGNRVHLFQIIESKYSKTNIYDPYNVPNIRPSQKEYYGVIVPDYVTVNYTCTIFTDFFEQMNKIVEAINFASDSYWGDPNRFKFRARIDSYQPTVEVNQGDDRIIKTTFSIVLNGYMVPDTIMKDLNSFNKFYSRTKIVFGTEMLGGVTQQPGSVKIQSSAGPVFINPASQPVRQPQTITNVTNVTNNITNVTNIVSGSGGGGGGDTPSSGTDVEFLIANKIKIANEIQTVGSNTRVTFYDSELKPKPSSITEDIKNFFTVYINGVYLNHNSITNIQNFGNSVAIDIDNNLAKFLAPLDSYDQIIAIGKFKT